MNITREILREITPPNRDYNQKFSANLAAWLAKHGARGRLPMLAVFYARESEGVAWDPAKTCPSRIYLGVMDPDGGHLCGSLLSEVITSGTGAGYWAHPMVRIKHGVENITEAFLETYRRLGKCAIDPEHHLYFASDRYEVGKGEESRTCRFCGRVETSRKVERVVVDTIWEAVS